ncbi:MAG: exodeoxyribonuclease III [Candidatus Hodarchaeales archaeon]
MKILSWNVNGIRACMNKGFVKSVKQENPDILCLQETKAQPDQMNFGLALPDYNTYWNSASKKGYSGVLTLTKEKPLSITKEFSENKIINSEGRFLQLEYENFYLINLYFPNAQRELKRLDFKLKFNEDLLNYVESLRKKKNVILCGDFNVAHKEIDLKNPKANVKNAGFSPEERAWFTKLLDKGYIGVIFKILAMRLPFNYRS